MVLELQFYFYPVKMNIPLTLLWMLVIVFAIVFVVISSLYINKKKQDLEIVVVSETTECRIPPSAINIETSPCCVVGSTKTASRYARQINMVVNPIPVPYLEVCQGYCKDGVTAEGKCYNENGQTEYDNCISISAPHNCNSISMPVAFSGITPYYPSSAGDSLCLSTTIC